MELRIDSFGHWCACFTFLLWRGEPRLKTDLIWMVFNYLFSLVWHLTMGSGDVKRVTGVIYNFNGFWV